jgi:methionyl-tRNA synthetase
MGIPGGFERILVTSALPYVNGPIHLGHLAGAYLPADVYVRFQRLMGRDIIYICGSDEHGVPITLTADREGVTPQQIVDRYHAMAIRDFTRFGMSFDHYSRTTRPIHHATSQEFFLALHRKGLLVRKETRQFFCPKERRFLADRYVRGTCPFCGNPGARGDQCESCGNWTDPLELVGPYCAVCSSTPEIRDTFHWYLPLGRLQKELETWIRDKTHWKENVLNYCEGWFARGLEDRAVTRDIDWGVPVPLEEAKGKVLYVWFDAPIGYISSTKEWAAERGDAELWRRYWCDSGTKLVHFIGKDNIVFHALFFPAILKAVGGYVLPEDVPANEFLNLEGRKLSTSGNYAVWLGEYLDRFPADALRYALAVNAPETRDTDFSWKEFQSRHNFELADILGNLVNRTLTFVERYYDGRVPEPGPPGPMDDAMLAEIDAAGARVAEALERFEVRAGARGMMDLARAGNKYFNDSQPWAARTQDPARARTAIWTSLQVVRALAVYMHPFLPFSGDRTWRMLGLGDAVKGAHWEAAAGERLPAGHALGRAEILFAKIEDDAIEAEVRKLEAAVERMHAADAASDARRAAAQGAATPQAAGGGAAAPAAGAEDAAAPKPETARETRMSNIAYDDFARLDLRTARIVTAERVPKADKLLRLELDTGGAARQIVAGVGKDYAPEDLVGKTIIIIANLEPREIRGVRSEGMLLAAGPEGSIALLTVDRPSAPGTKIS